MTLTMASLIPVRRRGRPKAKAHDAVPPTPETLAKLRPDHLSALLRDGDISPDQERAGRQIHTLFQALHRGASPGSKLREPAGRHTRQMPLSPLERLSERQEGIWKAIYGPWAAASSQTVVVRRPKLTALDLAERVLVDNASICGIAAAHHISPSTVLSAFQRTMDVFNAQKKAKKRL
jgi:hypothetical protein